MQSYLTGLENALAADRKLLPTTMLPPITGVEEAHLGMFLCSMVRPAVLPADIAALVSLCSQPESGDQQEDGQRLIMLASLLRRCSPNILSLERERDSLLHCAIKAKNYVTLQLLLDHGAEITPLDAEFRTPLHLAARAGDFTALQLLLQYRYDSPLDC